MRIIEGFGIACLCGTVQALSAPCYGYGDIFGSPSELLVDDLDIVKELKIGQDGRYLANINFLFEGSNIIQMGYRDTKDENFRRFGQRHGAQNVQAKRINLRDSSSRVLNLGWVFNETAQHMIAVYFVEYMYGI